MSNTYGENIRLTIFGQSHSAAIGMTLEGIPAGKKIDLNMLQTFLKRRAPGQNSFSTARKEADEVEFLCGIKDGLTCGTPITGIIKNKDVKSSDYEDIKYIPRPGHADFPAHIKYKGKNDTSGGGHFSGRLTAPLCIAGGILKQILEEEGIEIISRISSIGNVEDKGELEACVSGKDFPVVDDARGIQMKELILSVKEDGDSIGGTIECKVKGLPVGVGNHMFGGMENKIAAAVFGIPAIKGIEFGSGFDASKLKGSENNDAFCIEDGKIKTTTNNCGGILGGMTMGMPLVFKVAVKPTPSIYKKQKSVDMKTMEEVDFQINGRHDPCIVLRAVPCIEAAAAIAIYDAMQEKTL